MADKFVPYSAEGARTTRTAVQREKDLGPLKLLPGTWANIRPEHRDKSLFKGKGTLKGKGKSPFDGRGWNLIALPFAEEGQRRNYRLLMNQYNEVLRFEFVDDKVPNRGITDSRPADNADQEVAALDYEQSIQQISAVDVSISGLAGPPELPIHHEPGFFLNMKKQTFNGFNIARLATIPHGNAATALGKSREISGVPTIPPLGGLPVGVTDDIEQAVEDANGGTDYLFPYHHFSKHPFKGVLEGTPFPGFSPQDSNALIRAGVEGIAGNVVRTMELPMATDVMEAGIVNIPFIERQADAALMRSTFWIMELDEKDANGDPRLVLAYSQFIFLDFFDRFDGRPGKIRWPHISINMMEKIADAGDEAEAASYARMRAGK